MTDQKGSETNDSNFTIEAGPNAGSPENASTPNTPEAGASDSPPQRGRRRSAPKNAEQSKEKNRKASGGRAAAKAAQSGEAGAQTEDAEAAPKRGSRGNAAKTSSGRKPAAAKERTLAASEESASVADSHIQDKAPAQSGRTGKTGSSAKTGERVRQEKTARGDKNAATDRRSARPKPDAAQDAGRPSVDADAPSGDAPANARDEASAAKPASGRSRSSRGAAKSSRAKTTSTTALPSSFGQQEPDAPGALAPSADVHENLTEAALPIDMEAATSPLPESAAVLEAPSAIREIPLIETSPTPESDSDVLPDWILRETKPTPPVIAAPSPEERPEPVAVAHADFPSSFDDTSPEDFFSGQQDDSDLETDSDAQADASAEAPATGEKRRRSRSRRSRGRKKSAAQTTAATGSDAEDGEPGELSALADDNRDELEVIPDSLHGDDLIDDDDFDAEDTPARKGESSREAQQAKAQRLKMFVSVLPEEQVEVVITEEGQVQEYYVEMLHQAKTKGNIYKAVIHNVDPNLQAAFVSYGAVKNGFLQIDEIHPEYFVTAHDDTKGRKYPPIQKVIKSGQEVLVQVVKEPAGTKGAFLTTYLSLPGRFLVLTPGREQIGVSRKVENEGERARLRELLEGLSPGPGLGVIVRTVSMGASKTSLQRDLQNLKRTWKEVRAKGTAEKSPSLIYQEEDLTTRAVRDYLTESVGEVWIDDEATAASVSELAETLFPKKQNLVRAHKDVTTTLFERFNLQRQLDQIHSREVSLPSGGRLVIDPTEALTAIDINSGRSGGKNNFEDMAYRTNMEAARMIPLQLRLRDIGGQIVADFIEMRDKSHWREVEKTLRNGMKVDRARYDVGKIGPFGMLEIVRQRLGSSAISISTEPCPCCSGTGIRRNMEWQSQHALRDIHRALRLAQTQNQTEIVYLAEQPLALHLLNNKRQRLLEMEQSLGIHIDIRVKIPEAL